VANFSQLNRGSKTGARCLPIRWEAPKHLLLPNQSLSLCYELAVVYGFRNNNIESLTRAELLLRTANESLAVSNDFNTNRIGVFLAWISQRNTISSLCSRECHLLIDEVDRRVFRNFNNQNRRRAICAAGYWRCQNFDITGRWLEWSFQMITVMPWRTVINHDAA